MAGLKKSLLFLLFFMPGAAALVLLGNDAPVPAFSIDWEQNSLAVYGSADIVFEEPGSAAEWQLKAALQAEEELLKSFVTAMGELRVGGLDTARQVILEQPSVSRLLYDYFHGMEKTSVAYGERSVTMRKTLPFFGPQGFLHLLAEEGYDTGNFPRYQEYVFSRPFTGLVIDARGMGIVPSAVPRVWEPSEHILVYSAELMDPEYYLRWGSVQFTDDPYYREYRDRVGEYPLRVVAAPDRRLLDTDIALFREDVLVLLQEEESRTALEQGRVVVILDMVDSP